MNINKLMLGMLLAMASGLAVAGPVNINTADAKTLSKELEGVGPAKAEAIMKYRAEKGGFKAPEELKKVEGVGDAIYNANKSNIKLKD